MEKILAILDSLNPENPVFWIALLAVFATLSIKLLPLFEVFNQYRNRRLNAIDKCLAEDKRVSDETRDALFDLREALHFQNTVGIYAEKPFRLALLQLHSRLSPEFTWRSIVRAQEYLRLEDGNIFVHYTKMSKFSNVFNVICALLLFLFFIISLGLVVVTQIVNMATAMGLVVSPLFAILYAKDHFSYASARKIEKALRQQ